MPLPHYGVAIGTFHDFTRDPQHNFGQWYHGHVTLNTSQGLFQSALDVDAPSSVGVAYRVVDGLTVADIAGVRALSDGFHELAPTPNSGALDYARSPMLQDFIIVLPLRWWLKKIYRLLRRPPIGLPIYGPSVVDRLLSPLGRFEIFTRLRLRFFPWVASNGDNALDVLDPYLRNSARVYLFGQRYTDGSNGVHDVHCNQGDPAGTQWWATDGIWQDGAVACENADGSVIVWQIKFNTQSLHTDDNGHPI